MRGCNLLSCLLIVTIFIITSCKAVFIPTPVNTPMLTNRGEIQINTNMGFYGFSPQVAYALSNHIGFTMNLAFNGLANKDSSSYQYSIGPGIGYFYKKNKLRLELFTGLEGGKLGSQYSSGNTNYFSKYSFRNVYFQPTIGYTSKLLDIGFSSNLVLISFQEISPLTNYSTVYWEPVLTGKIGYKRLRFLTQLGLAFDLNKDPDVLIFPFVFTLGLNLNLGKARYVGNSIGRYEGR